MKRKNIRFSTLMYFGILLILSYSCEEITENQVVDIDGNVYNTVTIGTQVWFTENLRTTRLNDGTKIPLVTDDTEWESLESPGYCWYGNNEAFFSLNNYGALYNGYTAKSDKLCPTGWHIPTDEEWNTLILFLGPSTAGGKLKEMGTINWMSPNTGATNETGFTALPGGSRSGRFRQSAYFWTSSAISVIVLSYNRATDNSGSGNTNDGYSVRCIKDN